MNLAISNQCSQLEDKAKAYMYKKAYEYSRDHQVIRLAGLPIGIVAGTMTIATRIGLIAENLIKGIGNLLHLRLGLGTRQLGNCIKHACILPFSLLSAVGGVFVKTFGAANSPIGYFLYQWEDHETCPFTRMAFIGKRINEIEDAVAKRSNANTVIITKTERKEYYFLLKVAKSSLKEAKTKILSLPNATEAEKGQQILNLSSTFGNLEGFITKIEQDPKMLSMLINTNVIAKINLAA